MKRCIFKVISVLLLMLLALSACGPVDQNTDQIDSTDPVVDSTDELTTEATITEVDTDEQATTEEATTEAQVTESTGIERPSKEVKKVLMVGNSFCYYYVEELYGIAKAAGHEDFVVANLYESGCPVADHWMWFLSNKSDMYQFYVTDKSGRNKIDSVTSLKDALAYDEWDVITYQQHFNPERALDYDKALKDTSTYAKNLFNRTRKDYPNATLYWHQTWAYEVGYAMPEKYVEGEPVPKDISIPDVETQTKSYETIKKVSQKVAKQNGVNLIPSGDAWQIARADARVGDTMCKRTGKNGNLGDYYHDGDLGGGQYLNACVWYEVLFGESCIGNKWRPSYNLSEEKILALQEAAHAAVAAVYGENYAK